VGVDLITVIDLGEIAAGRVLDDRPARPMPDRRWVLVALALGLALVTLGGSAPWPRPLPMAVLDAPAFATAHAVGDRLFVADPPGPGDRSIAGYRLMDLEPLWRVDLPIGGQATGLVPAGDALVLIGEPETTALQPDGQVTGESPDVVGLDAATGATRWRDRGFVEGSTPGGRLLVSVRAAGAGRGVPASAPGGGPLTIRALSTDTGDVVWSYDGSAGAVLASRYDGRNVSLLAVLLPTGLVELRDADTGQIVRSGQIGVPPRAGGNDWYAEIVGDFLMVREASRVTAYGLDRLDRRWTIALRPGQDGWVSWCGPLLCLHGQNSQGISALDPQTGRVKWSDSRWSAVLPAGQHLVAMEDDSQRNGLHLAVIDPETGHARRDLGNWQAVDWSVVADSILVMQYDGTRALVARLEPARGVKVVGVLDDVTRDCRLNAPVLICPRTDSRLGIWRLPD
jgi:outer membrane protein assembly factor BamB